MLPLKICSLLTIIQYGLRWICTFLSFKYSLFPLLLLDLYPKHEVSNQTEVNLQSPSETLTKTHAEQGRKKSEELLNVILKVNQEPSPEPEKVENTKTCNVLHLV